MLKAAHIQEKQAAKKAARAKKRCQPDDFFIDARSSACSARPREQIDMIAYKTLNNKDTLHMFRIV